MDRQDKVIKIADHYGLSMQQLKCIEECAELTQAICKGKMANIVEEIADVQIMLWQLEYQQICQETVDGMIDAKLDRQLERMKEEDADGVDGSQCR